MYATATSYNKSKNYYKGKYNVRNRGNWSLSWDRESTTPKLFQDYWPKFNLNNKVLNSIAHTLL